MKISNTEAAVYVAGRLPFHGSNLFANTLMNGLYVVYSWGHHFPIYVYDQTISKWYGNTDKFSQSTTRHQTLAMPVEHDEIVWITKSKMLTLVHKGSTEKMVIEVLTA
jgi:hypothetical protein